MFVLNIKFLLLFITLVNGQPNRKKVARFDRFEICEIYPNSTLTPLYSYLKRIGYGTVVDSSFRLSRDIPAMKIVTKITRCNNKEQLDTCEYFTTIVFKNACAYAASKNSILSTMVYAHKPPFICPLRKGTYVCTNGTFDPNLVNFFPLENFYWKLEQSVFETSSDEFIYKICIEGQVVAYRE